MQRVLHAHALIDEDEMVDGRDFSFHELTFNMLVDGELEIILNDSVSANEKWSRLQLLKRLANKAQFLDNTVILEYYATSLRKLEKGKGKWGSGAMLRDFDESLRFRAFTIVSDKGGKGGNTKKWEGLFGKKGRIKSFIVWITRGGDVHTQNHMKVGSIKSKCLSIICAKCVGKWMVQRGNTQKGMGIIQRR